VRYLSVCSGIEAASVAWESLGWTPVAFAEIEKFPSKVLAHHYPGVANLGDMTKFREWDIERNAVDILVGGTPCQSFSVAGLRKGLDDPRGNLALTFIAMVDHYRPEWVIWENVPGVLSSSGGRDFGSFLGALGNIGYGFAYRVLDAQYFGVPQRRRRIFVVAHSSGDSRRAAEVLFEPESLRGDSTKSNRTGKETSYSFTASLGIGSAKVSGTLCALDGPNGVSDQYANEAKLIVMADGQTNAAISTNEIAPTLNSSQENPIVAYNTLVSETSHCVLASGGQRNDPHTETMVPVMYSVREDAKANNFSANKSDVANCIQSMQPATTSHHAINYVVHPAHAFKIRGVGHYTGTNGGVAKPGTGGSGYMGQDEKAYTIATSQDQQIMHGMAVRRLTPTECERLQGFPDGYTDIMPETPDGPRYKALGNSMAVPVMRWIGSRIALATK
jgi:DNA (cytosine-5)-methyltransferase 1